MPDLATPSTPAHPVPPASDERLRTRAVVVIALVLVTAALRFGEPVLLPLAVAGFLLVVTRPVYCWVDARGPAWLAAVVTTLVVLAATAVIVSGFALSLGQVARRAPELVERAEQLTSEARRWSAARGLPLPTGGSGQLAERAAPAVGALLRAGGVTLERLGLIFAFFVLGMLEVTAFRDRARRQLAPARGETVVQAISDIAHRVRRYVRALTITSLVSGVATGLFALAVGLDAPFTWGLVAFLLNYVPTIGPFVAVIPPTLYALLQFGGVGRVSLVFFGVGAIQFVIGNFVDPKIEGRALSLSALVVLVSVVFWGWLWGVFGALLGVPLTVAIIAVCERFERARWISALLTEQR